MWRGTSFPFHLSSSFGLSTKRVVWNRLFVYCHMPSHPPQTSVLPSSLPVGHPKHPRTIRPPAGSVETVETVTEARQFAVFLRRRSRMDTSDGKLCPLSSEAPGSALEKQSSRAQNQQTDHSAKRTGISGVTEENAKAEGAKEKRKTGRPDPIVQYVVLRKDLQTLLGWPAGAVIAQACHACISIVASTYSDPAVQAYLAEGDSMRKVVLEVHGEEELRKVSEALDAKDLRHKLWIEQPEGIPTCVAIQPMSRSKVHSFLKNLKLYS
uniref:peptidyl-tRNA hydrolase n=1 Tax=Neospora caninum (strain Liverpool) TaxID=572307 RepID=A0A0F7UQU4_NEOCL|nr:TPA: peptidyl-tRNA hydrolase 2, putative [Neospora caninum Liverpool]